MITENPLSADITRSQPIEQAQFTTHPEWFTAFIDNTDQKGVQTRVLLDGLQTRYPDLCGRIWDPTYQLNLLFLGAGVGTSEITFLEHLKTGRIGLKNVTAYYEDPSKQMQADFQTAASDAGVEEAMHDVYESRPFEDPTYRPPQVDLTLGFQMWHYVNGWKKNPDETNPLVKLASSVKEKNGVAIVSLQSVQSDNFHLRETYLPKLHSGIQEITAEEITTELDILEIPYDYEIQEATLNLHSFFPRAGFDPDQTGKNILSFILRKSWKDVPRPIQNDVAEDVTKLVQEKNSQTLTLRDGYIWLPKTK